ncbi:hypothetical protein GS415_03885 [Rhodococcus hoagii]|nr:hypothetical protein [Prescottella equi]
MQTVDLVDSVRPHTNPQHIMRRVNGAGKVILVNNPQTVEFGWERKHGFIQPEVIAHCTKDFRGSTTSVSCSATRSRPSRRTPSRHRDRSRHRTRRHGRGAPLPGRYLVGCEGGKSPTRKRLGVTFEGESPSTRWLGSWT